MGMFDVISDRIYCPYCGHLSKEQQYQTKDIACMLDRWTIKEIVDIVDNINEIKFYTECENCGKWVEILLDVKREQWKKKEMEKNETKNEN